MPTKLLDWFIANQLKIMSGSGAACIVLTLVMGGPWIIILAQTVLCLVIAFIGAVLYRGDTTENWLDLSWSWWARTIIGGIFIAFAWLLFAGGGRGGVGVIGQTIAIILMRLG